MEDPSDALSKRSTVTLFSDSTNHYSHRVRIVLREKGVTYDEIAADSARPPAQLAELNPYNSLPTLVDRDLVLYESKVMMEYLDERFPHPPLLPVYPVDRAKSRLFIHRIQRDWCDLVDIIETTRSDNLREKSTRELRESLVGIAPIFREKPFFMSDEFSLVDCCLAPILWRLPVVKIELRASKQTRPLLDYMDRLFERSSFQASLTEPEREMR